METSEANNVEHPPEPFSIVKRFKYVKVVRCGEAFFITDIGTKLLDGGYFDLTYTISRARWWNRNTQSRVDRLWPINFGGKLSWSIYKPELAV
jgi:hypothetical protein